MSSFFDVCINRFIRRFVYNELRKMKKPSNAPEYDYRNIKHTINGNDSPFDTLLDWSIYQLKKQLEINQESIDYSSWWTNSFSNYITDKSLSILNGVILIEKDNRFYPRFISKELFEFDGDGKYFLDRYLEDLSCFQNTVEKLNKNHGEYKVEQCNNSRAEKVLAGTKTVSVPTGNYTVKQGLYEGQYKLEAQTTTKQINEYKTVWTDSSYTKVTIEQNCWFEPQNEEEKERFLKGIEKQEKIKQLKEEYSYLGFLSVKRKKEIIKKANDILDYAYWVVGKACVDRNREYYQDDEKNLVECIAIAETKLQSTQATLSKVSLLAFEKRKEVKTLIKIWETHLTNLKKLEKEMPKRISAIEEQLAELDKKIAQI